MIAVLLRAMGGTVERDKGEVVEAKVGAAGSNGDTGNTFISQPLCVGTVCILILYSNHLVAMRMAVGKVGGGITTRLTPAHT